MTWQKKARRGIAVFVVVFVAIVIAAVRGRKPAPPAEAAPKRVDPVAIVENTTTGSYEQTEKGKLVFRIRFGTQFTYSDGRNKFGGGVEVTSNRGGRQFTVTSRDAETTMSGKDLRTAHFTGAVKLTSNDVEVTAEEATYDGTTGIMTIPGPVAFTRGRMKGRGVGATYDQGREVLWLLDKAHIAVTADKQRQGALDATSSAAGMARQDNYIRLTGKGHIDAEGRLIDADEITIMLTAATPEVPDQRVQMLQLRGNSRIAGGGGAAAPQAMSARDIDLMYAPDGRTLQHAQLIENGVVQLPGEAKGPGRRIAGKTIDISMGPDGATVTNLTATENVQVDLPGEGGLPAKRIRSATLVATGAPGTGLQNATFGGNVDYRETRVAARTLPAVDRTARAISLIVQTKPGLGAVQQADFHGNVHFTDGTQVAADAPHALYHVDRDQIDLSPSEDPGPSAPRVTDGRITVEARTIEFTLATRKLNADTKVRSSMLPQHKPPPAGAPAAAATTTPAPGAATARSSAGATHPGPSPVKPEAGTAKAQPEPENAHLPSLLKEDQPVTVTSNRLSYDGAAGHATYSGNARLWQGDTSVRGDTVIVDDKTGNLEARINVRTEMMMDDVDEKTRARKQTRTIGEADTFLYDDARRLATYTGKAHIVGPEGDVTGEKIELFLKPGVNELERAEGYGANGNVVVKENGRTATGERLTYTADTETYLMTGTPVVAIETTPPDCRKSVGAVLTFQRAVGTVSTSGNGVIRSVQNQIACPTEPR